MSEKGLVGKYRKSIRPPYNSKDYIIVLFTLLFLAFVPVLISLNYNSSYPSSKISLFKLSQPKESNVNRAASLSLSPASGNPAAGSTLRVQIIENSGSEPVNTVQADLVYDKNKLEFKRIVPSAAFEIAAPSSGGNGLVSVAKGTLTPKTGEQVVATVEFTVKTASKTKITFRSSSIVGSITDFTNILESTSAGTYN